MRVSDLLGILFMKHGSWKWINVDHSFCLFDMLRDHSLYMVRGGGGATLWRGSQILLPQTRGGQKTVFATLNGTHTGGGAQKVLREF